MKLIFKTLRVFNLWMIVIVVCGFCGLSERALSQGFSNSRNANECLKIYGLTISVQYTDANPRIPGQAPLIYGYPARESLGKIFTFPSGIKAPSAQVKFSFPVPEAIAKRTQADFDRELSSPNYLKSSWVEKLYLKIKARKSILARDFVGENEFSMDGVDLYFDNSYTNLGAGKFGYYIGNDLRLYVQIELKGVDHRHQVSRQWRVGKAVLEAVVDPKTGDYSEIKIIESRFEIRNLFSTI